MSNSNLNIIGPRFVSHKDSDGVVCAEGWFYAISENEWHLVPDWAFVWHEDNVDDALISARNGGWAE